MLLLRLLQLQMLNKPQQGRKLASMCCSEVQDAHDTLYKTHTTAHLHSARNLSKSLLPADLRNTQKRAFNNLVIVGTF